jgi:predicted acyltransferase
LQRIALCYLGAALIVMNFRMKGQAAWAAVILMVYWAVMKLVPVPGFGPGVLTPEGNLAAYIDQLLLPGRFCCYEFGDSEGLLSTLPAVSTTLLGVLCGHWLRTTQSASRKVQGLFVAGVASTFIAYGWHQVFPINKVIWTSSYVLFTAGLSAIMLGFFYWVIDVRGYRKWAFPFVVIGLNPITIYMAQRIINFDDIADFFYHGFGPVCGRSLPHLAHCRCFLTEMVVPILSLSS